MDNIDNNQENDQVKEITPNERQNKLAVNEYINEVLLFTNEHNISLLEYYRNVGRQYRVREESKLPDFERKNPFLEDSDIKLLIEREDNKIVEYFARAMVRVVNTNITKYHKNIISREEFYGGLPEYPREDRKENTLFKSETEVRDINKQEASNFKYEERPRIKIPKIHIPKRDPKELIEMFKKTIEEQRKEEESIVEDISFELLDEFGGYVVLRDGENINIYTYNSDDKTSLKDRVTYPSEEFDIRSGYYLSLNDFFENLMLGHPDTEISFLTEKGIEIEFDIIKKSIEEYCIERGGIRLKNEEDKYVDDLFINRKDLRTFLSKFKVKYTSKKEKEDTDTNVKGL